MPISMNSGVSASSGSVSSSTPTADFTPGVAATRASCCSVITLLMMSEAPFSATVKSALPTWRMAAADVRRLSVTSPRVSTVPTPTATATAVSSERTRLAHTLWNASPSQRNDHLQVGGVVPRASTNA